MTPRFGLCGTAFWAEQVHLPGLLACPDLTLAGIWGRSPDRTAALAAQAGIRAFDSFDQMLDHVDAVSFAVPPAVQADLAPRAIARGKHVLMEKPLGPTVEGALTILRGLAEHDVAGLCFLTRMFVPEMTDFVARARALSPTWGEAGFRSEALLRGPYAGSPWRQAEHGALWDAAPHGFSVLVSVLGPVAEVAATLAPDGTYAFSCRHRDGGTSTFDLNLRDAGVTLAERYSFGNGTSVDLPGLAYNRKETLSRAASLLVAEMTGPRDEARSRLLLGLHLVCVAVAAQESLASGGDFVAVADPQAHPA
jgi:predicted dehydrogenase